MEEPKTGSGIPKQVWALYMDFNKVEFFDEEFIKFKNDSVENFTDYYYNVEKFCYYKFGR